MGLDRFRQKITETAQRFIADEGRDTNLRHIPPSEFVGDVRGVLAAGTIVVGLTTGTPGADAYTAPTTNTSRMAVDALALNSLMSDVARAHDDTPMPGAVSQLDIECLTSNIFHEARGEIAEGQLAVLFTTLARVLDRRFPNSVCGVVYQRHQFSWTSDVLALRKDPSGPARDRIRDTLQNLIKGKTYTEALSLLGFMLQLPEGVLYYKRSDWNEHNPEEKRMSEKSKEMWRTKLTPVKIIGNHTFYIDNIK